MKQKLDEKCINKYIEYVRNREYYKTRVPIKANYYNTKANNIIQKIKNDENGIDIIKKLLESEDISLRLYTAASCLDIEEIKEKAFLVLSEIANGDKQNREFHRIEAEMILDMHKEEYKLIKNRLKL